MNRKIPKEVQEVFDTYPVKAQKHLTKIRKLILDCAVADKAIGELTETLKWGEPAYLTDKTKSGSTIRLGYKDKQPDTVAIYFNCQTTIVKDIKLRYNDQFECVNNRAVLIPLDKPLPAKELSGCIDIALKYHLNKKARAAGLL